MKNTEIQGTKMRKLEDPMLVFLQNCYEMAHRIGNSKEILVAIPFIPKGFLGFSLLDTFFKKKAKALPNQLERRK